jgi:hypothetical protein
MILNNSLYLSLIWTSTGFLMKAPILVVAFWSATPAKTAVLEVSLLRTEMQLP